VDARDRHDRFLLILTTYRRTEQASMADLTACASCANTQSLKQCARCKTVAYCSIACQRAHWQNHKPSCHFQVVTPSPAQSSTPTDALSLLRDLEKHGIEQEVSSKAHEVFNIPELRLAIFSELSAIELVNMQRICRSWYLTLAKEEKLQQRIFLAAGPGELVRPARKGQSDMVK
jgi:hypothetical protein